MFGSDLVSISAIASLVGQYWIIIFLLSIRSRFFFYYYYYKKTTTDSFESISNSDTLN